MRNYRHENKAELIRLNSQKRGGPIVPKKQRTKEEEKRSIIIRAIAFGVTLIAAVIAFATFAKQCTSVNSGWQVVTPDPVEDAVLFSAGKKLNYDFQGTGSEMRVMMRELKEAYTKSMLHIYKLLDPVNAYDGYVNLAYINSHRGSDIKVSPELYAVLESAKKLTEEGKANIFGGALYKEWRSILVLEDPTESDPLIDQSEKERIDELAANTAMLDHFSLELTGGDTVRFTVSEEYEALLKKLESGKTVLDLGFLREAYELDYTAKELEKAGFKAGFITTESGMTRCFSGAEGGYIVAYAPNGNMITDAFKTPMTGGLMCCVSRAYSYGEGDYEYYTVEAGGEEHMRHPHYDLVTGEIDDAVVTVMTAAKEGEFAEVCAESYMLSCSKTAEAAKAALASLPAGMHAAFIAKAAPAVIVADGGFGELAASEGFTLAKE